MMEPELPPEHASPTDVQPCKCCGRQFNLDTLTRHENICIRNRQKDATRKPFDSSKYRAMGTELESYNVQKKYNKTADERLKIIAYERQAQKKKQWKRKHEEFVNTIRSAREYDAATKTGASLPPPEPSKPNPDYVQCPYCKRRFQEHAAERHIPFCKEQSSRIDYRQQNAGETGSSALTKRLKYKPPSIRKRTDTEGRSENHRPAGSSLIPRKTNFQGTYNVNELSPGSNYNHGDRRSTGGQGPPRAYNAANPAASPQRGPFKPHPPSKLPPPNRVQGRLLHGVRRMDLSGHRSGAVNGGYQSGSDEQTDVESFIRKPVIRNPLRRLEEDDNQIHSSSRITLPKIGDTSDQHSEASGHSRSQVQERANSNSSRGGVRSIGSGNHSQLNAYGMTMSKFCYECGSAFPVPQAKYCSECGTKRI